MRIILPRRPRVKGRDYEKIWNRERNESPLKTITRAQAAKLAAQRSRPSIRPSWSIGRCATATHRSKRGIEALAKAGLRAHPAAAALSAICRSDQRDGLRRRVSSR